MEILIEGVFYKKLKVQGVFRHFSKFKGFFAQWLKLKGGFVHFSLLSFIWNRTNATLICLMLIKYESSHAHLFWAWNVFTVFFLVIKLYLSLILWFLRALLRLPDIAGKWWPSNLRKLFMYVNMLQLIVRYSLYAKGTSYTLGLYSEYSWKIPFLCWCNILECFMQIHMKLHFSCLRIQKSILKNYRKHDSRYI